MQCHVEGSRSLATCTAACELADEVAKANDEVARLNDEAPRAIDKVTLCDCHKMENGLWPTRELRKEIGNVV